MASVAVRCLGYQFVRNDCILKAILKPSTTRWKWSSYQQCMSASTVSANHAGDIQMKCQHGYASLSIPLPSRRERCVFTFLPATQTIGDFVSYLEREDKGTDHVAVYSLDGDRLAKSTPIDVLLRNDFHIVINDLKYRVQIPPGTGVKVAENADEHVSQIKNSIVQLYSTLNIEHYQLEQEQQLESQLLQLREQMQPFENLRQELVLKAEKRTNRLTWLGLGLMGIQFGLLARLTWWEYSWDIMEPVTYFVGYGSAVAMFGYYILTKQEYIVPEVHDREFLLTIHRNAGKLNVDVDKYNELQSLINETEYNLQRLRDPLQLHLPAEYLHKLTATSPPSPTT